MQCPTYPTETEQRDVAAVGGGGVSGAVGPAEHAADALQKDAPGHGVLRGRGHLTGAGCRQVVPHRLDHRRQHGSGETHEGCYVERRHSELTCPKMGLLRCEGQFHQVAQVVSNKGGYVKRLQQNKLWNSIQLTCPTTG